MKIGGAIGVALVDSETGLCLGTLGGGKMLDLDLAAAAATDIIRSKMRMIESLCLDDSIVDVLITLEKQYHLLRLLKNPRNGSGLFLYLVLDRVRANLGRARHHLLRIESEIVV
jgi:hypothetical protein